MAKSFKGQHSSRDGESTALRIAEAAAVEARTLRVKMAASAAAAAVAADPGKSKGKRQGIQQGQSSPARGKGVDANFAKCAPN